MTLPPVGWPPAAPFPASTHEAVPGSGPDFPASAGGREQGKFRPGTIPLTTVVAVTNDDGTVIGSAIVPSLDEALLFLRAIAFGIADMTNRSLEELLEDSGPDE